MKNQISYRTIIGLVILLIFYSFLSIIIVESWKGLLYLPLFIFFAIIRNIRYIRKGSGIFSGQEFSNESLKNYLLLFTIGLIPIIILVIQYLTKK